MFAAKHLPKLLATLALLFVTGCGQDTGPAAQATPPEVATLRSGSATAAPSASTPPRERPLIRFDASPQEQERLWNAYYTCLQGHGVTVIMNKGVEAGELQRHPEAVAACVNERPETMMERDERTNPQYADRFRRFVQCIRDQGIKVDTGDDGKQVIFTDDRQVARALDVAGVCERQTFDAK